MSKSEESRLDRLEALADKLLAGLVVLTEGLTEVKQGLAEQIEGLAEVKQGLAEAKQGLIESKQRTDSNARSIEALTFAIQQERKERERNYEEWKKDRRGIYELLGRLTRAQADFYETQSDFYNRFDMIDERQARMIEILDRLSPKNEN